jgi:hypothetical protein
VVLAKVTRSISLARQKGREEGAPNLSPFILGKQTAQASGDEEEIAHSAEKPEQPEGEHPACILGGCPHELEQPRRQQVIEGGLIGLPALIGRRQRAVVEDVLDVGQVVPRIETSDGVQAAVVVEKQGGPQQRGQQRHAVRGSRRGQERGPPTPQEPGRHYHRRRQHGQAEERGPAGRERFAGRPDQAVGVEAMTLHGRGGERGRPPCRARPGRVPATIRGERAGGQLQIQPQGRRPILVADADLELVRAGLQPSGHVELAGGLPRLAGGTGRDHVAVELELESAKGPHSQAGPHHRRRQGEGAAKEAVELDHGMGRGFGRDRIEDPLCGPASGQKRDARIVPGLPHDPGCHRHERGCRQPQDVTASPLSERLHA